MKMSVVLPTPEGPTNETTSGRTDMCVHGTGGGLPGLREPGWT